MACTSKWIRQYRRAKPNRVDLPAFNRRLRFLWRFASVNGRWLADILAGAPCDHPHR